MNSRKVFITGATGFVGFHVASKLAESGFKVTALVRDSSTEAAVFRLKAEGIETVVGDLLNPLSYRDAIKGASFVFHCAAVHKLWSKNPAEFYQINVEGTKVLLHETVQSGAEQFVYTSSIKTVGLVPGGISDEQTEYNLWDLDGHYGRSKYLAERWLLNSGEKIPIKILNPAAVIGPGDLSMTPTMKLISCFMRGRIGFSFETSVGLVDVRDVAKCHVLALDKAKHKEKYILCSTNVTYQQLFAHLSQLTGVPLPHWKMPYSLAFFLAYADSAVSKLLAKPPLVSPSGLRIARLMPRYCGKKAEQELGVRYTPFEETLGSIVHWLRENPKL